MEESQADRIRQTIAEVLRAAKAVGAVEVIFSASDVSKAVVGIPTNHPNVISALTREKMKEQTGFGPGVADRDYQSSSMRISFEL